jgi:phenylalanyl-tRNA synthetase beta chain
MKVPLSWLKDFVDIDLPLAELVYRLTLAGLEVEEVHIVGLPMPPGERHEFKLTGLSWEPDKIVVGEVREVMPHPNADRLVLCRLDDGQGEKVVLTGAPNLFPYKGRGRLGKSLKVAYAREGARIYDGHQPGQVLIALKRTKIRGVESYSMVCSEKELGISDEHEGIIILDEDAPVGVPLSDYMGDAVLEVAITPNMARNASVLGIAREIAALTGKPLRAPSYSVVAKGPSIEGQVDIEIKNPPLNPRFVLGLVKDVKIGPSPYWVERRLRLAGIRPINNVVDATNYVMLEVGQPLHAFDYDVLLKRSGGSSPTIITRTARPGERLRTLDGVERELPDFTVLVCDGSGSLSIAGVMGGAESEVNEGTKNVLLEGAAWNFINIRRTVGAVRLQSEAAYRFARGVHPAMAERGVLRGLEMMRQWTGGVVAGGLVDNYPLPTQAPVVEIGPQDVKRALSIDLTPRQIADLLTSLSFNCVVEGDVVQAEAPDHRLDIGEGIIGKADLLEEIARLYGYDRIPETRMADALPPQRGNPDLEREERLRDLLVNLGFQEVITYRLTSPEREARLMPPDSAQGEAPYIRIQNPIASDRIVMRRSLLASVLEIAERNARLSKHLALFEVGSVYLPREGRDLPAEPRRLVIVLTGERGSPFWDGTTNTALFDFYDLKGVVEALLKGLNLTGIAYEPSDEPIFHPGKCAQVRLGEKTFGVFGELSPVVKERFDLPKSPILAADFDAEALLASLPVGHAVEPVPAFPSVLEDIAVVVDESVPAARVEEVIRQAGGKTVAAVGLFDVYRGDQIGPAKKSLAYSLSYQASDRTLTDQEVAKIRERIIRRLESELGAKLRS